MRRRPADGEAARRGETGAKCGWARQPTGSLPAGPQPTGRYSVAPAREHILTAFPPGWGAILNGGRVIVAFLLAAPVAAVWALFAFIAEVLGWR